MAKKKKPPKFKDKRDLIEVTGLWKRDVVDEEGEPTGDTYLVGPINWAKIMIFVNKQKSKPGANPKLPDFKLFIGKGSPFHKGKLARKV